MITKAPRTQKTFSDETHSIIKTYFDFVNLKQLYRQGWLYKDIPHRRCESVAEHSFGVAVIALLLVEQESQNLDLLKILKMCLIHDFGEIFAGDFIPDDPITPEQKHQLEKNSIVQVFRYLPNGEDYLSLWEEFEQGETPEAKVVRQIDKLEMALQARVYQEQGFENLDDFYKSATEAISDSQFENILNEIISLK